MDAFETDYRNRPRNPIAIRHYVNTLLENEHILEASFFNNHLLREDGKGIGANILAYRLAIRRMDGEIANFDKQLHQSGASKEDIYSLRLLYYFTFGARKELFDCASALLDMELKTNSALEILIDAIEDLDSYDLASKFIRHHYRRLKPSSTLDNILKRILIHKICEILCQFKKVK